MSLPVLIVDVLLDPDNEVIFSAPPKVMRAWLYKRPHIVVAPGYGVLAYGTKMIVNPQVYLGMLCLN